MAPQEPHPLRARAGSTSDPARGGHLRATPSARWPVDRFGSGNRPPGAREAPRSTGEILAKAARVAENETAPDLNHPCLAALWPLSRKGLQGFGTETSLVSVPKLPIFDFRSCNHLIFHEVRNR